MKIYKNCYKKSVQDYVPQKLKSGQSISAKQMDLEQTSMPKIDGRLNVSTELPYSLVHELFYFILAFSSTVLVFQLNIASVCAVAFSLLFVSLTFCEIYNLRKQRKKMTSLQCIDHVWFLKYTQGQYEKLELQSISHGLGFLYLLSFASDDEKDNAIKNICIWKYQSKPEFLAYCSQLISIGQKDC